MGASPKVLDTEKQSPLHIACEMGNLEVVKLLLTYGLSTNLKDVNGFTPYDYARKNEYQEILDELTRYDVDNKTTQGDTPDNAQSSGKGNQSQRTARDNQQQKSSRKDEHDET